MNRFILFTLTIFVLVLTFGPSNGFADAYSDWQDLKAENAAKNDDLMDQFQEGEISGQELEAEWKKMAEDEAQAAQKTQEEQGEGTPNEPADDSNPPQAGTEAGEPQGEPNANGISENTQDGSSDQEVSPGAESQTGTANQPYEQPDINYRDPDLFVDPAEIFDIDNRGKKDPYKRMHAVQEIFHPNYTTGGGIPRHEQEHYSD